MMHAMEARTSLCLRKLSIHLRRRCQNTRTGSAQHAEWNRAAQTEQAVQSEPVVALPVPQTQTQPAITCMH